MSTFVYDSSKMVRAAALRTIEARPLALAVLREALISLVQCLPIDGSTKLGRFDHVELFDEMEILTQFFGTPEEDHADTDRTILMIRGSAETERAIRDVLGVRGSRDA